MTGPLLLRWLRLVTGPLLALLLRRIRLGCRGRWCLRPLLALWQVRLLLPTRLVWLLRGLLPALLLRVLRRLLLRLPGMLVRSLRLLRGLLLLLEATARCILARSPVVAGHRIFCEGIFAVSP